MRTLRLTYSGQLTATEAESDAAFEHEMECYFLWIGVDSALTHQKAYITLQAAERFTMNYPDYAQLIQKAARTKELTTADEQKLKQEIRTNRRMGALLKRMINASNKRRSILCAPVE